MEIISRKEAKERGLKFYFTGEPCKNGHLCGKRVANYNCLECEKERKVVLQERQRRFRESLPSPSPEEYTLAKQLRKEEAREKAKEYNNRPEVRERRKAYSKVYDQRPEQKERRRKYREEHKEDCAKRSREWRKSNKNREHTNSYRKEKYHTDKEYKANKLMRGYLERVLKLVKRGKTERTADALGYTPLDIVESMECKMLEGMSWDNHGDWHIDHKKPVAEFLREGVECPRIINGLDNLIPMWSSHNVEKKDKNLEDWLNDKGEESEEYHLYSRFL